MIDHLSIKTERFEKMKHFYTRALEPIGMHLLSETEHQIGYGKDKHPFFWISKGEASPIHFAFSAPTKLSVDHFHQNALTIGAKDEGAPDVRPDYHNDYYAAYVLDPDGNRVEACNHGPDE